MLSASGPSPHVLFGQGKSATTLLTEDGCIYPIISSLSYTDRYRSKSAPYEYGRGSRPMHRTTLQVAKPPWLPSEAYKTSNRQYFSGSKSLNPVRRPPLCPSMHRSQWDIGYQKEVDDKNTHYSSTFVQKDIIPANRLHLTSLVNRIDQTEGGDMRKTMHKEEDQTTYWTQYNRIHNKLGNLLGPGVSRERDYRRSYNVLTGEETGQAWKTENKRVSGNRVLHDSRNDQSTSILG